MSEKNQTKRRYNARVEYRVVQKEVETLAAEGHRARGMYEDLTAAGRLTMSCTSFCDYLRGQGERLHTGRKNPPPEPTVASKKSPPRFSKEPKKSEPFIHERDVDLKELI